MTSIHREIPALSIPLIIANITTPLLGLIDVAIVGNMGSAVYIAAIAVGGAMFNMIYWPFAFLRMGSSGMTAQAYGAENWRASSLVLYRALLVALLVGLVLVALQQLVSSVVIGFMEVDGETRQLAERYFSICVWGAPAMLGGYALTGWFIGMQSSRSAMWMSIFINVINIIVSLMLVYLFDCGFVGVAYGTLIAQWGGLLFGIVLCLRSRQIKVSVSELFCWVEVRRFFSINADIFLRTLCLVAVTLWFTSVGAHQGDTILAVNALLMQLFLLFSYFMDGFAFAGEALVGKYIGARQPDKLAMSIKALFQWSIAVAVIFTLIYLFAGERFLHLLSNDVTVVEASSQFYYWAAIIPIAGFMAFTWDGVFIGATRTRAMLMSMFVAMVVFFVLYKLLITPMGNHGLWLAFIAYLFVRGIVLSVIFRFNRKEF